MVVAGDTNLHVTVGHGDDARQSLPLPAYRGVPAGLAGQLARVPGVAAATGEAGFPGGVVRSGDVDLVAVTAKPGVSSGVLAARIRAALHGGRGYTIATGAARGDVADLNAAVERSNGQVLGAALIPPIVTISLFVLAATTGLAVNLRRRRFALLRTVGATRGQVRRAILAELAVCGVAGGVLGWLPGVALGGLGVHALAAHQMLPAGFGRVAQPVAAARRVRRQRDRRRAERADRGAPGGPHLAGPGAAGDRGRGQWPSPVRILLGLVAAGGAGTLMALTFGQKSSAGQLALALPLLLACMLAVALLGPVLVALRGLAGPAVPGRGRPVGPARAGLDLGAAAPYRLGGHPGGPGGRHGGRRLLRRRLHRARHRHPGGSTVTADRVISGPGLTGRRACGRSGRGPGCAPRPGVAPVTLAAADPDLEPVYGEAVAGGPLEPGARPGRDLRSA